MATLLQTPFGGSGALASPFVKISGPDLVEGGGLASSATPASQSAYKIDVASTTLPSVIEVDGYLTDTGGVNFLVMLSWQSDNKKYLALMTSADIQFYLHEGTDFSTGYTAIGTSGTGLGISAHFRLRFTHSSGGVLRADLWTAPSQGELGTDGGRVLNNFNRTDTSNAGAAAITTAGKAGLLTQRVVLSDLTYSDAGVVSDTTAPTLSAFTATGGVLSATGSISTNEAGTLWHKVDATSTASDPGVGAETADGWTSQVMSATGAQAISFGTVTAGSKYGHAFAVDGAGNRSTVANTAVFIVSGSGDTTPPTLTGTIAISNLSPTGYTATCPTGADNVGVTGYQWRIGGSGAWTDIGSPSFTFTGRTPSSTDALEMRCRDAAGNFSVPLSLNVALPSVADTTAPTLAGAVTAASITSSSATLSWPAGSDNVAVTGYEYALNGGAWVNAGNVLTANVAGLTAATAYAATVRAYDAAGNRSAAISGSFTTATPQAIPSSGTNIAGPFFNNTLNEPYRDTTVFYTWWAGAGQRIGSLSGTPVQGAAQLDANGYCAPTSGRGLLMASIPRTDARDDDVYYQAF